MIGVERNKNIKNTFNTPDAVHSFVQNTLSKVKYPNGSQIVISGPPIGYLFTGGYWIWSTGYLKYTIKRNDITGLVGKEKIFYDPFNPKERGYSYTMKGLDLNKPLFLFRINYDGLVKSRKIDFLPQHISIMQDDDAICCGQNKMLGLFTRPSIINNILN